MLQGNGNYTWIYYEDCRRELISKTLQLVMGRLQCESLLRVHKSYCVNKKFISPKSFVNDALLLSNGQVVEISRRKRKEVKLFVGNCSLN
jgi:DNA-binding LytR/AlgR family response regulator